MCGWVTTLTVPIRVINNDQKYIYEAHKKVRVVDTMDNLKIFIKMSL